MTRSKFLRWAISDFLDHHADEFEPLIQTIAEKRKTKMMTFREFLKQRRRKTNTSRGAEQQK
jgi:hypothetical protein